MANQTCHVVMTNTYCAPYREMKVNISVCVAMCMDGVMCDDAYRVYRLTKDDFMFIPLLVTWYSALPDSMVWSIAKPRVFAMNMLNRCEPDAACS